MIRTINWILGAAAVVLFLSYPEGVLLGVFALVPFALLGGAIALLTVFVTKVSRSVK